MNKLEKAAEKREIEICQYSTKDCLNTNDCHRCQWGVPSLDLRCSNNASFKLGAQWKAKQSPWISVADEEPPEYKDVLLSAGSRPDIFVGYFNGKDFRCRSTGDEIEYFRVLHWMPIPE